ncbi:MAG: hypothetical protein P4L87_01995 [Formivibrio sp.]|nr:hypothetical protein [Formivibrio sp.]
MKNKIITALFVLPMAICNASSLGMISVGISGSIKTISEGISDSSKSSSAAVTVAEGDYKVIEVADADGHPNQKRIALQSLNQGQQSIYLFMSKEDFKRVDLALGKVVTANPRLYGVAFTKFGGTETFAVVLDDSWLKELDPVPVTI